MMRNLLFACLGLWLAEVCSAEEDRLAVLLRTMQHHSEAGDPRAAGELAPALLRELGRPNAKAALGWNQLGLHYGGQGDFAGAERAFRRGLSLAAEEEHVAILELNLGQLYLESGRGDDAEALLRRALPVAERVYAGRPALITNFLNTLAAVLVLKKDHRGARAQYDRALTLTATAGSDTARTARGLVLSNMATMFCHQKNWPAVRSAGEEARQLLTSTLGADHPDLVPVHLNLAQAHLRLKEWSAAEAAALRARQIVEARLGGEHMMMSAVLQTIAKVKKKTGHGKEAKVLSLQARELRARTTTPANASVHVSDLRR